jgi:hypothetical protein
VFTIVLQGVLDYRVVCAAVLASILILQIATFGFGSLVPPLETIPYVSAQEPHADFELSCSPNSLTIEQGTSDSSTCTVQSINRFSFPVNLFCQGLPSGVTCDFLLNPVIPPPDSSDTSTLTVSVDATALVGTSTFLVVGVSDVVTHTFPIDLTVIAAGDRCDCLSLSIKPKLDEKGKLDKDAIKVTKLERVTGRGRGAIEVKIEVMWTKTIKCDATKETDICSGIYKLEKESKWKVNVPKNKKSEGVDGKAVDEKYVDSKTATDLVRCEGPCNGQEKSDGLTTEYSATVENSDRDGFTLLQAKGTVHLTMKPFLKFCKDEKGWDMFIRVDSTKPGNIDDDESDYDGDTFSNKDEKKAKKDPLDPNSHP